MVVYTALIMLGWFDHVNIRNYRVEGSNCPLSKFTYFTYYLTKRLVENVKTVLESWIIVLQNMFSNNMT